MGAKEEFILGRFRYPSIKEAFLTPLCGLWRGDYFARRDDGARWAIVNRYWAKVDEIGVLGIIAEPRFGSATGVGDGPGWRSGGE